MIIDFFNIRRFTGLPTERYLVQIWFSGLQLQVVNRWQQKINDLDFDSNSFRVFLICSNSSTEMNYNWMNKSCLKLLLILCVESISASKMVKLSKL